MRPDDAFENRAWPLEKIMLESIEFLRTVKAVERVAGSLGFDGCPVENDSVKIGTYQQQLDKVDLYDAIPSAIKRIDPELVWRLVDSVVMTTPAAPTATPPPRQAEPAAATTSSRDRPAAIDRHHAAAVRRVRKQQRGRSRC